MARPQDPSRLSVARCAATGAAVLAIQFLICWTAAAITEGLQFSHMFVELFTAAPVRSGAALVEGLCWSLVFGALTGALVAIAYNLFARLERQRA